ncbi:MAG: RICIN domain-containing protein [Cytophagaceae bacterium]|nr:RICIN domain-containing protein [Cytophagaceae bacterium]
MKFLTVLMLALLNSNLFAQSIDQRAENIQNGTNNIFMSADKSYYKGNSASDNDPYGYGYWVTAHTLETLADAYQRTRNTVYRDRMKSILAGIRKYNRYAAGTYRNDYYDDLEWLCLATFNCYNATKDPEYLNAVHDIWAEIKTGYVDGAMSWKKGCTTPCKNSIANAPAIIIAVKLYQLEGDPANLQMAKDIHAWMKANVLNAQGGIWDGPGNFNEGWQFSYNSGMFIGACLELSIVTGAQSYIDDGIKASEFMMNYRLYNGGVFWLNEKGQGDGGLFKGIFAKWFTEFVRVGNLTPAQKDRYLKVIHYTGDYAWANSVNKSNYLISYDWGALPNGTIDLSTQTSGVHLFESAASLNKVHVYQNINYAGFYSQLPLGNYTLAQLQAKGVLDNDITSFTIPTGYSVMVYENDNFTGVSKTFTANTGWLADWNDRITSLKITDGKTYIVNAYQDINYGGYTGGLDLGNYTLAQLQARGIQDNDITSFKIAPGFKVTVYEGDNFTGTTKDYTADINWLADWNDKTSSLKVIDIRPYVGTVYQDVNFGGYAVGLDVGDYTLAQLKDKGISDNDITSLKIAQGFKITAYDGDNFTGTANDFTADNGWLADWNDKISSLRIRANGEPNISGTFYIQNRNSGLYTDVFGISTADGANISQGAFNGGANQQFKFESVGDGAYKVIAVHSGKVMEVEGLKKDNGANVQQQTYTATFNQQFIVVPTGDGFYKLIAKHSGKVVEVANASLDNNANIQQGDNNNQTSGQWKFVAVTITNGNGDGLTGNYFNGMNFETAVYSRKDATLNMDWGFGSPNAAVNADGFSARWTGLVQPKYSGEYTFYINSDNGRRVWVNNVLIIDQWADNWGTDYTGKINLIAQQKYDIKVEYFENVGGANIKFEWSSAQQTREVVPTSQLYSNPLPTVTVSSSTTNINGPANITLSATAADADGISKVDFYNGTTLLGTDATAPYSYAWSNLAVGTYTVKALATDAKGGVTLSANLTIKVNAVVVTNPNVAPTVSLTSPANNVSVNAPASLSIAANAADSDGSVAKVEFYNGTQKLGEDASSPYAYTWTNVTAGNYTLTAKAYDNTGAITTSASVTVKVVAVVTDQCAGIAAYAENGGYVPASKVKNVGKRYECKEFPYSGWCNGAAWAYAPGSGAYWTDAWYERGSCTARAGEEQSESNAENAFLIVPNPASDVITINSNESTYVSIFNSQGVEVITQTKVEAQGNLQLSHLSSGIYLVRIDTGSGIITQTLVKN